MAQSIYSKDIQFAGLVEAATAAADKEVDRSSSDGVQGVAQSLQRDQTHSRRPADHVGWKVDHHQGELRSSCNGDVTEPVVAPPARKRRRRESQSRCAEVLVMGQAVDQSAAPDCHHDNFSPGLDSAAALFRTPSATNKKCTRPPMSKLFSSLQLPPEDFLHLQSAAKAYMLAEDRPERRDCVGQRGRTDSDMVKLRLWNCVQEFLDREGNGKAYFGASARKTHQGHGPGLMIWPSDAQQIIKTCVPLLRRMVTNERQRRYAVETRKSGGDSKRGDLDQGGQSGEEESPKAPIDDFSDAATLVATSMGLRDTALLHYQKQASRVFNRYNSSDALSRVMTESGLPPTFLVPVVFRIDAHCRADHGHDGAQCTEECRCLVAKEVADMGTHPADLPSEDLSVVVNQVFDVVLAWDQQTDQHGDLLGATDTTSIPQSLQRDGQSIAAQRSSGSTLKGNPDAPPTNGQLNRRPTELLIHLIHQARCLLPPLALSLTECQNIASLKQQILTRHGPTTLREQGVTSIDDLALKVWLPDGLVTIRNDGQWMVALLSADTVEWMGGQIRVLLEVESDL